MSRARGSIVVDEVIVPITDMWLDDGMIHFEGRVTGPVPDVDTRDYVVTDRSGRVVFVARGVHRLRWAGIGPGRSVVVQAALVVLDQEAVGRR